MEQVDLNKSLLKSRLIYKNKNFTILDISSFAILLVIIGFVFSLKLFENNLIKFIITLTLVALLSSVLSVLKWNYTMRLEKISTAKTKKENRQIIEKFIEIKGFEYRYHNDNHIQSFRRNRTNWFGMELNFIIKNNEIYFNTYYWDSKFTLPSFRRIKKYIKEINELKNASEQ
ncbi:hypothetical protein [Labilibacter marinus]|uniref:hypothetical protein n=1 Tax=Labilibacter marinus TaxID=1477105 RepID=UPI00094FEA04|nr:hypothetical protein [Labilibacter marinus]